MSLFGAARLYVVSADLIERDLASPDAGAARPRRDGAWALWARQGESGREVDPRPPVSRVEPGPVHIAYGRSDPT